jgi:hypothetical protein
MKIERGPRINIVKNSPLNFDGHFALLGEPVSSVSIVSSYGLDDRVIEVRSLAEAKGFFPLASVSRPALGPTWTPVQWVLSVLFPRKRGRSLMLTAHY